MLKDKIKIKKLNAINDVRGSLVKIFDYIGLKEKNIQDIYITYTAPNHSRANHYHKKTTEWFCAIKGRALIKLKDIETGEEYEAVLDGKDMAIAEIPPKINHHIFSLGNDELILLAFGNQPYTEDYTDTFNIQ